MDFQQATTRFQWLEGQLRAGLLNEQQYRLALNDLRVTDAWGRLWMPQERTGAWFVFQNGQWQAAQPPVPVAAPPPPPAPPGGFMSAPPLDPTPSLPSAPIPSPFPESSPVADAPFQASTPPGARGSVLMRYLRAFLIWLAAWIVIGGGVYIFLAKEQPEILYGVGLAAVLSLVLLLWSMGGRWKGQVTEIRLVRENTGDEDGPVYENVRYAFIREANGRIRRERAMPAWQAGDWLEKRQGENWVRKL
jgi:hypothetical protein